MARKAAITIDRPREGVQRLWQDSGYRPEYIDQADPSVEFVDAPGDRGTEIYVDLEGLKKGTLGQALQKLTGSEPEAKVKDDLRRFKQHVETGVISRSEGAPEGELAERKLKQRPAQHLEESEIEKAGV